MSNVRTIKICALNIAMHKPHSPKRYIDLFNDAKKRKVLIRLGALHSAMLGSVQPAKGASSAEELTGEIYRFVNLDPTQPWFNLETKGIATDDEVGKIQIPEHLLPHLQRIEFVFRPDTHQLWFISQDRKDRLGVSAAVTFFQQLFDHVVEAGKFPKVEVTALPDADTLETMLSLSKLEKITIDLKRPNADDGNLEERRFLKKLEKQNAQRQIIELVAVSGLSIQPDAETRALASVASRNGNVSVVGRDEGGRRVEESTQEKPLVKVEYVDSDEETSMDVLLRTALTS
jgi:hypothetical protein